MSDKITNKLGRKTTDLISTESVLTDISGARLTRIGNVCMVVINTFATSAFANWTPIFSVPSGFRPKEVAWGTMYAGDKIHGVCIDSNGIARQSGNVEAGNGRSLSIIYLCD